MKIIKFRYFLSNLVTGQITQAIIDIETLESSGAHIDPGLKIIARHEFIGFKDKNDKEVFEKDILEHATMERVNLIPKISIGRKGIAFNELKGRSTVRWDPDSAGFVIGINSTSLEWLENEGILDAIVIGNTIEGCPSTPNPDEEADHGK